MKLSNTLTLAGAATSVRGWLTLTLSISTALAACGSPQSSNDDLSDDVVSQNVEGDAPSDDSAETNDVTADESTGTDGALISRDTAVYEIEGVTVLHKSTPGNLIVAIDLYFDGGVTTWSADESGLDSFAISVMTSGGPASMEKAEFNAALDAVGASIGGSSGYDFANLSLDCVRPALDTVMPLFIETVHDPAMRSEDIELTRERLVAGLQAELDSPDAAVVKVARSALYDGHPYANRPEGEIPNIAGATEEALASRLDQLLDRDRMVAVVVGDLSPDEVEALLQPLLAGIGGSGTSVDVEVTDIEVSEATVSFEERPELPTNYILGYYAAPDRTHPDYPALQVATTILDERLFEEVRTKRNLTYAVAAGLGSRRANAGYLYVTATDPNTTMQVIFDTIEALENGELGDGQRLDAAQIRNYMAPELTSLYMGLQSNGAIAGLLASWHLVAGDHTAADEYLRALESVTPEDVQRVVSTYLTNLQFGVVGNPAVVDEALFTSR